ncbi:MAG: hypothetical protein M1827_001433 [Pycnora praestabilis]|nr:MAG: hypothetical protein M1827_001433 [Pycnora praestabilis]
MPEWKQAGRLVLQCLRNPSEWRGLLCSYTSRSKFSTASRFNDASSLQAATSSAPLDPMTVSTRAEERALLRTGVKPIGSRRRRAALQDTANLPFEQLPYQCFQEARNLLRTNREEKLKQIEVQRGRIARLKQQESGISGGEMEKQRRLRSMRKHLEELKILADINDPVIKKRFEDGEGDMNRPIYRYLADRKWRSYRRPLLVQRVTQMNVIPDVFPQIDPTADVRLAFSHRNVQPGEFVDSRVSEIPAKLDVQVYDKGERLLSVVVLDSDVPDLQTDGFNYRCHFLAANIASSPMITSLPLSKVSKDSQLILPWLPPYAQKGSSYHRLSVFVMQQQDGGEIDASKLRERVKREGFNLRSFTDKYSLRPIGVHMFRNQWDEGTAGVMRRAGIEDADLEFRRKKVEPLPYKKKDGSRYR